MLVVEEKIMIRTIRLFVGSMVTYGLIAACSGSSHSTRNEEGQAGAQAVPVELSGQAGTQAEQGGETASGGASEGGAGAGPVVDAGGIIDALTDPVPDAQAAGAAGRIEGPAGQAGQAGGEPEPATGGSSGAPACVVCECECPEPEPYEPPEPEVVTVECDRTVTPHVAILHRDGMGAIELSAIRSIHHRDEHLTGVPEGFTDSSGIGGMVKDGALAVTCDAYTNSVTFIIP
jgi:hypothetical protein